MMLNNAKQFTYTVTTDFTTKEIDEAVILDVRTYLNEIINETDEDELVYYSLPMFAECKECGCTIKDIAIELYQIFDACPAQFESPEFANIAPFELLHEVENYIMDSIASALTGACRNELLQVYSMCDKYNV